MTERFIAIRLMYQRAFERRPDKDAASAAEFCKSAVILPSEILKETNLMYRYRLLLPRNWVFVIENIFMKLLN